MYKATASGQQFLERHAMHSTKGSRKGFDLLEHGVNAAEELSPEEQRASLVARWKQLNDRIIALPKASPERRRLGFEIQDVARAINAIRPKMKGGGLMRDHFMSVAKERLPKAVYQAIVHEAALRAGRPLIFRADTGADILTLNTRS